MSLGDLTKALYGEYTPTGSYSVEFRNRNNQTITEVFFARPPIRYSVRESQRSDLQRTLHGGFIGDAGNDFKTISVTGELYEFGVVNADNPLGVFLGSSPRNSTGLEEFFKLRYILMRYRDYTMTRKGKIISPNFNTPATRSVKALQEYVSKQSENQFGALADEIKTVWHCEDKADNFFVKINEFSYDIESGKQFTIIYNITMDAYEADNLYSGKIRTGKVKERPIEALGRITDQMKFIGSDSLPEQLIASNSPSGVIAL